MSARIDIDECDPAYNPHPQMRDLAARLSRWERLDIRAAVIDGRHVLVMPECLEFEPWASMTDDELAEAVRDSDDPDFSTLPWGLRAAAIDAGVLQGHQTWSDYGLSLAFPKKRRKGGRR